MTLPASQPASATVLVVDDLPENLALLFDVLSGAGFKVLVAASGDEALERLPELQPDLILLDVLMPGRDGFAVCRELKQDAAFAEVPVIFMTARSDTVDKVTGFRAGAVDYVGKPFEADEVLARVRAHLQLRRMRRELEQQNESLAARSNDGARPNASSRIPWTRPWSSPPPRATSSSAPTMPGCCSAATSASASPTIADAHRGLVPDRAGAGAPLVVERPDGSLQVRLYSERGRARR